MEPIQADRTEQEKLVALTEKLANHNANHGKNVVFWSCKKCNPEPVKPQILPRILDDRISFRDHIKTMIDNYKPTVDERSGL